MGLLYCTHHHIIWPPSSSALGNMTNICSVFFLILSPVGEVCAVECLIYKIHIHTHLLLCVCVREDKVKEMHLAR